MTNLLMWVLALDFIMVSFELECKKSIMKNIAFDCHFQQINVQLNLRCESKDQDTGSFIDSFYLLQLSRKQESDVLSNSNNILQWLLTSPPNSNSTFYSCESNWRYYVLENPSTLVEHCKQYNFCIQQASKYINASFVKIIEIADVSKDAAILKDLNKFFAVVEINIHDTSLVDFSEIRIERFKNLKSFTLKRTDIYTLPDGIFSKSQSLRNLDLSRNKIYSITNYTFGTLTDLRILNLSSNLISHISKSAFTRLPNLKTLYLMNNELTTIDGELFRLNYLLEVLHLSNNSITHLPEECFYNLKNFKEFHCKGCQLSELNEDIFLNSTKLLKADFSNNGIKTIPKNIFEKQFSLVNLDFSRNKLIEVPIFRNKTNLRILNLSQNEIRMLNENLSVESPYIKVLMLKQNKIEIITYNHFKNFEDLEYLDLTENKITLVDLTAKNMRIRKLMLSNNFIKVFKIVWTELKILEILEMDNNQITYLDLPPCISNVKQTITFSFRYNNISRIGITSLIADEKRVQWDRSMAHDCFFNGLSKNFIDISFNPLICDCELYSFYNYIKKGDGKTLDTFINKRTIQCSSPEFLQKKSVISLPDDVFSCPLKTNCPFPCKCGLRGKDDKIFVNCTGGNLNKIPKNVPEGTTVLYFSQNNLTNLDSINYGSWTNLTELHADYNKITSLTEWKIPENLEYLSLRGNNLESLPQTLMDFISNQSDFQFMFGENLKRCNCDMEKLKKFLTDNKDFIKDLDDIACEIDSNGTESVLPLHTIPLSVLCAKPVFLNGFDGETILISLCVGFFLLIALVLFYYKQRQLILSFLYIHCDEVFRVCFEENDMDYDKIFDAFIAYSSSDRHIVMHMLRELEEKEPHFKLCIHERDWLPGRFISDNIIASVQSSKRTIIILSNDFISSPWFRLELRAAIFEVSGDKKNKLIAILADKSTSLDGIDTEIRHVISKRTYLVWGESWFWEKLRYAMPRQSCLEIADDNCLESNGDNKRGSVIALV